MKPTQITVYRRLHYVFVLAGIALLCLGGVHGQTKLSPSEWTVLGTGAMLLVLSLFVPSLARRLPSPEAREIYDHLTPHEFDRLSRAVVTEGLLAPVAVFLLAFLFPFSVGLPLGLVIGWIFVAYIRTKTRQALCETNYARQKGCTPETLRLTIFERKHA